MNIVINGEPFKLERQVTVSKLLEQLNIDPRRVAVEHNLVVLKRAAYDSTLLKEGDEVVVVNFVGSLPDVQAGRRSRDPHVLSQNANLLLGPVNPRPVERASFTEGRIGSRCRPSRPEISRQGREAPQSIRKTSTGIGQCGNNSGAIDWPEWHSPTF